MSHALWVIVEDTDPGIAADLGLASRVGIGMSQEDMAESIGAWNSVTIRTGLTVDMVPTPHTRFRLLDDDGEVYYVGVCSRDWFVNASEDEAYMPLKWAEADAGATSLEEEQDNGEWKAIFG